MYSEAQILALMREKVDHPATARELLQLLKVPREARPSFKRRLRALVAAGSLVEIRGNRFGLPDLMNLIVGRVSTNPRGFGFVDPEVVDPDGPASIFIAGNNLNQAMHGDRVVVRVERQGDGDRAEGRILRIVERGTEKVVGRYERTTPVSVCRPLRSPADHGCADPEGETQRRARRDGDRPNHALSDRHASRARAGHRGAGRHRRTGRGHHRHHPQVRAGR
jgi:exoribonuclease R